MNQYLKSKAIDKIPVDRFQNYELAAVKFTINVDGKVANAYIAETSRDSTTDGRLLETIRGMPCWTPAQYSNGAFTNQEFVFTVGNMESCLVDLLNIRPIK